MIASITDISTQVYADPTDRKEFIQLLKEQGEVVNHECRFRRKDGTIFWGARNARAVRDEDGRVVAYQGFTFDITERKRAEDELKKSEATVKKKLKAILEPDGEIGTVDLADIIDQDHLQQLMDDLFRLTGAVGAILDLQGNVLASCGWQDICVRFHRVHPDTRQHCLESDTVLTTGTAPGEVRLYQCRNGMWDVVTPIHIGGNHIGNVFCGQFFLEDEAPDTERFRRQARQYGFDEKAYIAALDRVPRWSREKVDRIMTFYARLAATISAQGYGNLRLARSLTANERTLAALQVKNEEYEALHEELSSSFEEVQAATEELQVQNEELQQSDIALRESDEKHRRLFETMAQGVIYQAADGAIISANPAAERILGLTLDQMRGKTSMDRRWRMINALVPRLQPGDTTFLWLQPHFEQGRWGQSLLALYFSLCYPFF
ncbi:PocR ligand-binding domain-containing protein, partial [Desulfonatronospira sp.]|uniref:PocR ligand-binding domain-containing protein n=1 Tax=Desulfonatronospira sp. TaxID=1962951 RepID=UPI0025C5B63C